MFRDNRCHPICARNSAVGCNVVQELSKFYPSLRPKIFGYNWKDGHCVEIPSPVFTSVSQCLEFYDRAWTELRKYNYQPHHHETVCGGNHIHIGISKSDLHWVREIYRHMAIHPEITWTFISPDDTDSADVLNGYDCANAHDFIFGHQPDQCQKNKSSCLSLGFKKRVAKPIPTTLEFRCVEAPKNKSEFIDQLDFFISYILYIKKRFQDGIGTKLDRLLILEEINEIPLCVAEHNFYSLLAELGLDKERYKKYVNRNLRPKWELERVRVEG